MSFLDPITAAGPATSLQTNTSTPVQVDQADPPTAGQVLVAVDAEHAEWQDPSGGGGVAMALATAGDPVYVAGSSSPLPGQVLVAVSPAEAEWATLPAGGLTYGGESNDCVVGEWVHTFTNGGAISIPASAGTESGDTFGVSVQLTGQNKHIVVPVDSAIQLEGRLYAAGATVALRAGGYYEWSAQVGAEGLTTWFPRASHHTLTPPLERAQPGLNPPRPNSLVYASETGSPTLPGTNQNLKDGDSFAVYVDAGCTINVPAGVRLVAIDWASFVDGPGSLTLSADTYHEWVYYAPDSTWVPRESGQVSQGAIESALERDVGPSLSLAGKVLSDVGAPAAATDAATRAYVDSAIPVTTPGWNGLRIGNNPSDIYPVNSTTTGVYATLYTDNRIGLFDGSQYRIVALAALPSFTPTGMTADIPVDIFLDYTSPTSATLTQTNWSSATARATAVVRGQCFWHKSGDETQRYLGTILPASATNYTFRHVGIDTSPALCSFWNVDNRIETIIEWMPTFPTWSPAVANSWNLIGAIASPHIRLVQGLVLDGWDIKALATANPSSSPAAIGIGINSNTVPASQTAYASGATHTVLSAQASHRSQIGRRDINMIAYGSTSAVFVGNPIPATSGISLRIKH